MNGLKIYLKCLGSEYFVVGNAYNLIGSVYRIMNKNKISIDFKRKCWQIF